MYNHIYLSEGLRKHDVCFLVTVKAKMAPHQTFDWSQPFVSQVCVCVCVCVCDECEECSSVAVRV